jgi:TRAP-type C4-dicarboxylate transport system permease small subunit
VALLTDRLPDGARHVLRGAVHLLMFAVAAFALIYGTRLCIATWGQVIGQLPWMPVGLTYTPVPIGGLVTALFVVEHVTCGSQHARPVVTFDHAIEGA